MDSYRNRLKEIIKRLSILRGDFTLSSGEKSNYYIDARVTTLNSEGANLIARLMLNEIRKDSSINTVGGPTLGADPIIGALLFHASEEGKVLDGFIVRKNAKGHGTEKLIEGNVKVESVAAVVEDVVTTGGSVLKAVRAAEASGITVKKIIALVDREKGAAGLFSESGYEYVPLFSISELLEES